jgi:hypothetical protein
MIRAWLPKRIARVAIAAAIIAMAGAVHAADLFYNNYVAGNPPAQLYPSPRPTPPLVGHTYITYQPLYPQEFLYHHHRTYARYDGYHSLPVTRTRVSWKSGILPCNHLLYPHRYPEVMFQYAP